MNLKENKIACFILAGGKSSRFKSDKAKVFYKYQYKFCKKHFKNVYFVAKYKKFKKYPFFIEKNKSYHPLFALREIIQKYKKVFVFSIDSFLENPKKINILIQKKAVAKENPLIGYYDYTMLKKFKTNKIYGINKEISIGKVYNINKKEELKLLPNQIRKAIKIK